ncbi:MarR family winged helix-turn-helix transcriptional regulator [Litoribacillus peritrichatus]|uniref:MarR family winged helix-turn-helix transcriptional regulator n=1 Tax=Litoribacillus peritrichatus TaxID=718191 RepID=A0ABP7N451_9GAMM
MTKGEKFTELVLEIFKVNGMLNIEGDQLTSSFGLTSARWKVLGAIGLEQRPLTVSDIARLMGQSRQGTQRLVDAMVKDGVLAMLDNPNHKRAKLIQLTIEGQKIYEELDETQRPWAADCAEHLSNEQLETALTVLKSLAKKFES